MDLREMASEAEFEGIQFGKILFQLADISLQRVTLSEEVVVFELDGLTISCEFADRNQAERKCETKLRMEGRTDLASLKISEILFLVSLMYFLK